MELKNLDRLVTTYDITARALELQTLPKPTLARANRVRICRWAAAAGVILLLVLVSAGCVTPTPHPPPRESPDLSVIGVSVNRAGWGSQPEQYAYFVRLEDRASGFSPVPIRSNFAWDGYVYLFNARPGRYVVVVAGRDTQTSMSSGPMGIGAVSFSTSMSGQTIICHYLPKTLIEKTVVSVGSGEWVFMGEIVPDQAVDWEVADDVQRHYLGVLAPPGYEEMSGWEKFSAQVWHHAVAEAVLDRGEESLARFLATSREVAGEEWASALPSPLAAGPPDP
jgi:hypothetical protein